MVVVLEIVHMCTCGVGWFSGDEDGVVVGGVLGGDGDYGGGTRDGGDSGDKRGERFGCSG